MKYAFFGSPKFAAIILEKLIRAGMPPAVVACNPDRPSGRKQIVTSPPTKLLAEKHGIRVLQPDDLKIENFKLKVAEMDFGIVAAYAKILPQAIIENFKLGIIGVHPSLLPKYRGATPIQNALLAGEAETGTTLFLLDAKVDHGPIIASRKLQIANSDNYETLLEKLANLSADLLIETLPKFNTGAVDLIAQDESQATYTKKFATEDAFVDFQKDDTVSVQRKIRALNPEPGVYSVKNGKRVKILDQNTVHIEGKKPQKIADLYSFFLRTE